MNRMLLLVFLTMLPATAQGVQCPIPNCPEGQLCFCPPPPPHYLVVSGKGEGTTTPAGNIIARFKANLRLTGYFAMAKRFAARTESPKTPLDQISPWSMVELSLTTAGDAGTINVKLYRRLAPRSARRHLAFKTDMTFSLKDPVAWTKASDILGNQVMAKILGRPFAAFGTKLAFVHRLSRGTSVIRVGQVNGQVTKLGATQPRVSFSSSLNKEPLFSPDGRHLVFTSHIRFNPDLYITEIGTRGIHRISSRKGVNHAAAFAPDGKSLALTLDYKGNPDIFLLATDYSTQRKWRVLRQLTRHHTIDTSPAFSPDGKQIAFVSTRKGRAQIFIKNVTAKGGRARLLFSTPHRTYTPKWCRAGIREYLAFTQLVGNKSVIFIYDVRNKNGWRATSLSAPNAENPSWSPHCNLIAYESDGSKLGSQGIRISPIIGGRSVSLFAGPFTTPTWGK